MFTRLFPDIQEMSVVDLGGTVEFWRRAPVRPAKVTIINLSEPGEPGDPGLIPLLGDACKASRVLEQQDVPSRFDIVVSNSLMEHVGGHAKRLQLAQEVRDLAPFHWVQTPYRYFPVEPHWVFPGMQFLPVVVRTQIALRWPLSHILPPNVDVARREVMWTELLGITEMEAYFPQSVIYRERMLGVVKSIIAVSSPVST
jgi:hypothetical protein